MGAMHTRLETMDRPVERLATFYATRAEGEIGLIFTGGYSPVPEGVMDEGGLVLDNERQLEEHSAITTAVKKAGGQIILQILHAGRYAKIPSCVAPSEGKARINIYNPRALAKDEILKTISSYAKTAALAEMAGYAGVEIMGSEGYLISEFTAELTNRRDDEFGGSLENRLRFPLQIIRAVRAKVSKNFIVIYRISSIDLMDGGLTGEEIVEFARQVESAGADMINTGVGWHESVVPTIAATVPRAAWVSGARNIKQAVRIPVMASNRINTPELAEEIIASGAADFVSMARPLLADPEFAKKTRLGIANEINTCIACNQACLDRIFTDSTVTCLVNPKAGREIEFTKVHTEKSKRIAVIGGGPAGMAFALNAAQNGHHITLFEADLELGGQLNMAKQVPGKNEFNELLRYFDVSLRKNGVKIHLNVKIEAHQLAGAQFDAVVLATGVVPRIPPIKGVQNPIVLSYVDVLKKRVQVGSNVAIIGAGGIGFDVAEFLSGDPNDSISISKFMKVWGVDISIETPGGIINPVRHTPPRSIVMFQRKAESLGRNLGKSTGWILKAKLRAANVLMVDGVTYNVIDDNGLHYTVNGEEKYVEVDNIILCTGQISNRSLFDELKKLGITTHVIGGADVATELDALRAIDQATRLAASI